MDFALHFPLGHAEREVKGEVVHVRVCKREGCGQEIDR